MLSESISKSSCAFPMMSNAIRVWVSWAVRRTFWARNRSTSPLVDPFEAVDDLRASPSPETAPASRAAVHSLMWEWYSSFPAQHRALLPARSRLVLLHDRQPVRRGERAPDRSRRRIGSHHLGHVLAGLLSG